MKPESKSARADGRGGWAPGHRRHPAARWEPLRVQACQFIELYWKYGRVSVRALSLACGVSERTATRWLDGTDVPSPEGQAAVKAWLKKVQSATSRSGTPTPDPSP